MCKLFVATGAVKRDTALLAIEQANNEFKFSQRDGFGFLAVNKNEYGWGRYATPAQFSGFGSGILDQITGPKLEEGAIPSKVKTLLIHGRTSTNVKSVTNCHPFKIEDTFLIHNGILDYIGDTPMEERECDSESFLDWWVQNGDIEEIKANWAGYGAIFLHDQSVNQTILIKDDTAKLYIAKRKFDGYVFSTDKDNLLAVCKAANIQLCSIPVSVPECVIHFDETGEIESYSEWSGFAPRKYDYAASCSMGGYGGGYHGHGEGTSYYNKSTTTPPTQSTLPAITTAKPASEQPPPLTEEELEAWTQIS